MQKTTCFLFFGLFVVEKFYEYRKIVFEEVQRSDGSNDERATTIANQVKSIDTAY